MTAKLKVTRAEYIRDLANTKIEKGAYEQLAGAYRTLAAMPENEGINRTLFLSKAAGFTNTANRCGVFLEKLEAIDQSELLP